MSKTSVLVLLLALGSVSMHALTPSCDIFRKSHEGWQKGSVGDASTDRTLQQYLRSAQAVYESWCGEQSATSTARTQVVAEFVEAYNAERFSEVNSQHIRPAMGLEMLAVVGLTHELPERMQTDPKLREAWIQDCQDACFAGPTPNASDARWQLTRGMCATTWWRI